jgi:4-aminobutyrate--pyruvate transaminase
MWGSQTFGMEPDILTCAKALTSGYIPIAAVMINEAVFDAIAPQTEEMGTFGHGFTYSGHPVPAAVAIETLRIYEDMDLIKRVKKVSRPFLKRLHSFSEHPLIGETMGVGLIGAIELVCNKATRTSFEPPGKVGAYLVAKAQAHRLIVRQLGDRIAFSPPLIISNAEIATMFDRFAAALDETHQWLQSNGFSAD